MSSSLRRNKSSTAKSQHAKDAPTSVPSDPAPTAAQKISALENELLDEYTRLDNIMKRIRKKLLNLAGEDLLRTTELLGEMEKKSALISTLLKSSVYSIVLQQQVHTGDEPTVQNPSGAEGGP
ncbi:MAG: hypothetical protein M1829_004778 [Trizodia sp. TS-e1964]|nr:MAG: hypothetical protein M1829_004778 [Trizodia sp. TS-e1964]